ncbi:MAG: D-3-phosphoglycerate dehydrogenase [Myxococcales bacterium]|jgi:D-3-phosphoglycerate dehydrogenase|nr:D-3-phosphoglycerate dehydrogenase [Myxococcales bacterium]
MRLLIADKLHPRAVEELRALPLDVVYEPEITKETLETKLGNVGILVVRSTEVTAKAIEGARQLNLIVRAGNETTTIDVRAASKRGVYVANCPGRNASAVAELVFGMLVALDRRIPDAVQSLREGRWERLEYSKAEGLIGKTLGIAGLGAIGREVAMRARAFGLHPVAWSRSLTPSRAAELGIGYASSLEELAQRSDALTVHLALTERTRNVVGKRIFDAMPKKALFVNVAREGLVDYEALRDAVAHRGLRAAVDVYPNEPKGGKTFATDLFVAPAPPSSGGGRGADAPGFVYGTPHIAASTDQAQLAVAQETVRVIRSFLLEGAVPNVVNVLAQTSARFQLVIRMLDKVGTFANVLAVLKRHGINVEEVNNNVFEGGVAACAKLRAMSRPNEACLSEIRAFEEVLHIDVVPLPNLA